MSRTFLTNIDLVQNELLNAVVQNLASAPSNPKEGQIYTNTTSHLINAYLNSAWVTWISSAALGAANRRSHS